MKFGAGSLNRRIEFKRLTGIPDGVGGTTESYVFVREVWAAVREFKSGEGFLSDQIGTENRLNFIVRYESGSDISSVDAITYNDVEYGIVGQPIEMFNRQFLKFTGEARI
ncbi:MAG: phage head closure protein [Magnetococcales bacterium]|nr:phage head closure protein [Magnetococcales bacterium]